MVTLGPDFRHSLYFYTLSIKFFEPGEAAVDPPKMEPVVDVVGEGVAEVPPKMEPEDSVVVTGAAFDAPKIDPVDGVADAGTAEVPPKIESPLAADPPKNTDPVPKCKETIKV